MVFVLVSLWAWSLTRSKLVASFRLVFALYVGFLVASAYGYGYTQYEITYEGLYNRYAVALLCLIFVEALGTDKAETSVRTQFLEGASTGVALVVAFLKANFFAVGMFGIGAGVLLMPQHRVRWCGLGTAAVISSFLMLWYLNFDEGLTLLRRHLRPTDRITALDFSNPFSFALQQPPPRGDALWWHLNVTFNRQFHPSPQRLLGDATLVMVGQRPPASELPPSICEGVFDLYSSFLGEHFTQVDESPHWRLYRKR